MSADMITLWSNWMLLSGSAPKTVYSRAGAIRRLSEECGDLLTVTRDDLATWLAAFAKASTRSTNLSYVRCFFTWAVDEGHIADNPTRRLPKVKVPKAAPRPVPMGFLGIAMKLGTEQERLWLELMCFAGLRVSEVALCRPEHVWRSGDGSTRLLIPRGKGGHEQQVNIPTWLAEKLENAAPWTVGVQAVYRHTKALLLAAGSNSTPHACRHYFATSVLHSTHNLRTTQEMMRHADPSSTARYTLITSDELVAAAEGLPRFAA